MLGLVLLALAGRFLSPELPPHRWFEHYASRFKTVELNAPFYSWPTTAAVKAWVKQAGRQRFVYTGKVSELITHVKRFAGTKTLIRDLGHIANLFGARGARTRRAGGKLCSAARISPNVSSRGRAAGRIHDDATLEAAS